MPDAQTVIRDAMAQAGAGRLPQAIAALRRVTQREPRNAEAVHWLGMLLARVPDIAQAEFHLRRAIELQPGSGPYHCNLATTLGMFGRHEEAIPSYRRSIELEPKAPPPLIGLSRSLRATGRPDAAAEAAEAALRLDPGSAVSPIDLGLAQIAGARAEDAVVTMRDAASKHPADPEVLAILAFVSNYSERLSTAEVFEFHRAAGRVLAPPADAPVRFPGTRDPERRLRVGYMSPDFRNHSVAWFAWPLIERHDRGRVEVVCLSTGHGTDDVSRGIRAAADRWIDLGGLTDSDLADRVRREQIDVLVELSGYSIGHRLGAAALRMAPVTCTYIGYANTTGVPAVGARIVDALTDDEGSLATERLVRLDRCFLCYRPPAHAPEPGREPGPLTFGSFNTPAKISPGVIEAWAAILSRVAGSRLLLKAAGLDEPSVGARLRAAFGSRGVDPARLELVGHLASSADHLALYRRVDVALDPFPYNGTTTTCEALWMGVPVVTVAGDRHAARVGLSLLTAAWLPELVATDRGGYIDLAAALAGDAPRLHALRSTMRDRLRASALCDADAHARAVESAYRGLWRAWCGGSP